MEDKNTWCVYMHTSPSGKVYIGITCQRPVDRWQNGAGYLKTNKNGDYKQPAIARAVKKYGWENFKHVIFAEDLDKEQAEKMEQLLIAFWKTNNSHYGYNIREGGGSVGRASEETKRKMSVSQTGKRHTEETKIKISKSKKGKLVGKDHPNFGTHHTDEAKRKISESLKGKMAGENNPMYGVHPSEETREKMRQAKLGKPGNRRKAVYCIELDRQWDSIADVKKEIGGAAGHISEVIKGTRSYAGRHPETGEPLHWEYVNENI